MNKVFVYFIVVLLISFTPLGSSAERRDRTGFFTNLHFNKEGGDLLGYELYIGLVRNGYTGVLYECQGGCFPMQVVEPSFDGDKITFNYADIEGELLTFRGIIDREGITGSFYLPDAGPLETIRLKRKKFYWNN